MIISNNCVNSKYTNIYELTKNNIVFPVFQRGYNWKKEQAKKLLEDILYLANEDCSSRHFKQIYLLDFIWYEEDGKQKIADGQQRLVTLNLLIKAINDRISYNSVCALPLKPFSINYDDVDLQEKYFQFFSDNKKVAPFKNVYMYFSDFLYKNPEILFEIVDIIKNNIYIFLKEAANVDDAFEIFKQINSGGKPLSKQEIIKTTLVQYSNKFSIPITKDFVLKDINNLIVSYYKLLETPTSGNFDNFAIMSFLNRHIIINKESFQNFYDYLSVVKDINEHPIYYVINYINKSQLLNILYILGIKKIDILKERSYMENVLFPLCLLSIIWKIKKTNPGGVASSIFVKIIDALKQNQSSEELRNIIYDFVQGNPEICKIDLNDFVSGLGCNLDQKSKKALLIMDVIMSNTSGLLDVSAINLEHIFPRNPDSDWDLNGWPLNEEDKEIFCNSIGNYMLLSEIVNKKIQNKYISEKKKEYERIIPKDKLLFTKSNYVNFERFEFEKCNYIVARQKEIGVLIQQEFPFGTILII